MEIRVRLPRIPPGLGTNLLGLAGLVAIIVAIGMLAGAAWAVMGAGVFALALAVLAQYQTAAPGAQRDAGEQPLRRVA